MADTQDNSNDAALQDNVAPILLERFDYNVEAIDDFLTVVFHTELAADENILTWISRGNPAFPITDEKMLVRLGKSTRPSALYFGTSTTVLAKEAEYPLRNKKELFKRFHVLVLDDIGDAPNSKVPFSKLPTDFEPTYIIETSKGNFQYGYVLEIPLTDIGQATALVQLVYEAGFSDSGGAMATKLVRLPDGVNGKKHDPVKAGFHVKLHKSDGPRWHPEDILDALDLGVEWEDVVKDADAVRKQRASYGVGTSAWTSVAPQAANMDGIVDPVAEWLYEQGMVKQETNDFLTITCPWADTHTDGGDWASYSPMARGDEPFKYKRIFHCFHEHCKDRNGLEFLEHVAGHLDGPKASVREDAAHLVSTYVLDPFQNGVWDIKSYKQPNLIPVAGWKLLHPEKTYVVSGDGSKAKLVAETTLFMNSPARVSVSGHVYDPSTEAKIVEDKQGNKYVNMYTQPDWGDGEYDQNDVDTFTQFLEYLIPNNHDREHYLNWLAAKCQSMTFRGTAMLMIAESQGTGRSTLGNMLTHLFGFENTEKVKFKMLGGEDSRFNDWVTKPLIITDETYTADKDFYKVYESLKDLIDTTPERVRIDIKFGNIEHRMTYSSFMLFSNHINAMKVAEGDRRIYVLHNAKTPASPEYFIKLHEWLDKDDGAWARAVWRWLRQRPVNVADLVKPPEMNKAKRDMINASKQSTDIAVEAVLNNWPCDLIVPYQVKDILAEFKRKYMETGNDRNNNTILGHRISDNCQTIEVYKDGDSGDTGPLKFDGNSRTVSVIKSKLTDKNNWLTAAPITRLQARDNLTKPTPEQKADILAAVADALTAYNF